MHEIALVRNIFTSLEEAFPDRLDKIRGIYLTVGLLSNVQPVLMENAFAAVLEEEPRYGKTTLHMNVLPVKIRCRACGEESEVAYNKFICPCCGEPGRDIIQGEELLISKVEFED